MQDGVAKEMLYFSSYRDFMNQISHGLARIEAVIKILSGEGFDDQDASESKGELEDLASSLRSLRDRVNWLASHIDLIAEDSRVHSDAPQPADVRRVW